MGSLILLIAFVTEAAFASYCIFTRSNQQRGKSFMRIGLLAIFVLATLTAVIHWSFRWYGLATLLLIWALLSTWTLLHKRAEQKAFSPWRTGFRASGSWLLVFLAVIPALIFPQVTLPKPTGTYQVATVSYTYTDPSRRETFTNTGEQRKVNVACWYPQDTPGKYPLVVFSHGAFGMKGSNTSTLLDLASNGYVVCAIDHPYHALLTRDADGHITLIDQAYFQEVIDLNHDHYDEATKFKLNQKWLALRSEDINFVLNTLKAAAQNPGAAAVYRRIDPEKIGLSGHSLGGEASAQVARERNDIDAVINLDADLGGEYVDYVDGKYVLNDKVYPVPILNIFTDALVRLMDAAQEPNVTIAVKHVIATAPHAYAVHLKGTNHMSVTDLSLISPLLVSLITVAVPKNGDEATADPYATLEKMNKLVLACFNAYLKGAGRFTTAGAE